MLQGNTWSGLELIGRGLAREQAGKLLKRSFYTLIGLPWSCRIPSVHAQNLGIRILNISWDVILPITGAGCKTPLPAERCPAVDLSCLKYGRVRVNEVQACEPQALERRHSGFSADAGRFFGNLLIDQHHVPAKRVNL